MSEYNICSSARGGGKSEIIKVQAENGKKLFLRHPRPGILRGLRLRLLMRKINKFIASNKKEEAH